MPSIYNNLDVDLSGGSDDDDESKPSGIQLKFRPNEVPLVDDVTVGGHCDIAGVQIGDFLTRMNGLDCSMVPKAALLDLLDTRPMKLRFQTKQDREKDEKRSRAVVAELRDQERAKGKGKGKGKNDDHMMPY